MITYTTLHIDIAGKDIPECIALELEQTIHGHHHFRAHFSGAGLESDTHGIGEDSLKKIGAPIKIGFSNTVGHKFDFNGVITTVNAQGSFGSGHGQNITFEGFSPTILLENGAACQAFNNLPLSEIITKVTAGTDKSNMKIVVKPLNDFNQHYTVQYNETTFAFINRISKRYGEWCYFDGADFVIGDKKQPTINLIYGSDLSSFSVNMQAPAIHRNLIAHSYKSNDNNTVETKATKPSLKGSVNNIYNLAHKTWQSPQPAIAIQFDDNNTLKKQMDDAAKTSNDGMAAQTLFFRGESVNPSLFPGAFISIEGTQGYGYGSYIITDISHSYSIGGEYHNFFTAVPSSTIKSPMTNIFSLPFCEPQPGVVTDNNDPEGLGRVKVRQYWQADSETPWLRISMPYTGPDKGMYFVPEIGEEVMLGFEGGNAEKPFVMGALYNGKMKPSGFANDKNDIKAICTRSGHIIRFNDADGGTSISIEDPAGNCIQLDTKGKSITITAPETMTLNAKNLNINVDEKMTTNVGKDMVTIVSANHKLNITEKFELTAAEAIETIDGDKKIKAKGDLTVESATTDIISKEGDILIKSAGVATMQGKTDAKVNKG